MKTLVTLYQPELRHMVFPPEVTQQLESITDTDWVPESTVYTQEQLIRDIAEYDAIITGWGSPKISRDVLAHTERLKFIGHTAGTLVPYIDPDVFERSITVVNANTALARSTAELAVTLMLNGAWKIAEYQHKVRQGQWHKVNDMVNGLYKQRIGIIGLGEVSKEVIRLLQGFQAEIYLYSPYCDEQQAAELGVERVELEELMQKSRIISLHDTLTKETRGMIGQKHLDLMEDGALLVNTARAPLIDEEALTASLTSGRIYAALDVYHHEPLSHDDALLHLPNVICVPHIGAMSAYWRSQLGSMIVEDLQRFIKGESPLRRITGEKFTRMTDQ